MHKNEIINEIKQLVTEKGYLYVLCIIILENLFIDLDDMDKENFKEKLNIKEISFIIGFFIKSPIETSFPPSFKKFLNMRKRTYKLFDELHHNFFSKTGNFFVEPIFYSGTGAYDFQYLDFLYPKYKFDKEWLLENRNFDIEKTKDIVLKLKEILELKIKNNNINNLKKVYQEGKVEFYNELLNLFTIKESYLDDSINFGVLVQNFSIIPENGINLNFNDIGDFNEFCSKPIIKLSDNFYFIPVIFQLFEAVYESPFYWISSDKEYKDVAFKNRGICGEDMVYNQLLKVFGENNIYKSVEIKKQNNEDVSEIDILCIYGNKAICFQVKSKKLTLLSRKGNETQLKKDFKYAIQNAYNQGLICRNEIFKNYFRFFSNGKEIKIPNYINDVYLVGVITENYPSLLHQSRFLLEKKDNDPNSLFLSIFDLELLATYLSDPYEFLYYIRQRISLMDYLITDEEIHFLGFHMKHKLDISYDYTYEYIEDYGQLIDKNYYKYKIGISEFDKTELYGERNIDFENLCAEIKNSKNPEVVDIIYILLDIGGESRDELINYINLSKEKTFTNNNKHNFSLIFNNDKNKITFGVTYISESSDDISMLKKSLFTLSQIRKYKSRCDYWIGIGSLKNSDNITDTVLFLYDKWEYDEYLENISNDLLGNK